MKPVGKQDPFVPLINCWICGGAQLILSHQERIDPGQIAEQPEWREVLGPYVGHTFFLNRCQTCGFFQPNKTPRHPRYFEALYDGAWSPEWMVREFDTPYKDYIFRTVLARLDKLVSVPHRTLLDIGAHVGRMIYLAEASGWAAEGLELNRHTAAYARIRTGRPVHRIDIDRFADTGAKFHAITLTDVLEHIPDPVATLCALRRLLIPGGWLAVKVPYGLNQRRKQLLRSWFVPSTETGIALSMVHINHFSPMALRIALARAGFIQTNLTVGAPELFEEGGWCGHMSRLVRLAVYHTARLLPGGTRSCLALNLQAYSRNPS